MTASPLVAYKRGASPENTFNVFGVDVSFLMESKDTGGRLALMEYVSKPGHEPPPHWHENEDETFYIIEGHIEAHCGDQVLHVKAGECIFLPMGQPHAWIIRSASLRAMLLIHPAGGEQVFKALGVPLSSANQPASEVTYTSVLHEPSNPLLDIPLKFGIHVLTREEIARALPHFPLPAL